ERRPLSYDSSMNSRLSFAFAFASLALLGCGSNASTMDASTDAPIMDSATADVFEGGMDSAPPCAPNMDFSSDPLNCGACGRSCLGGTCVSGKCGPVEIGSDYVYRFAVDANGVFWAFQGNSGNSYTDGAVRGVPITATKPTDLYTNNDAPMDVSIDANNIYFV